MIPRVVHAVHSIALESSGLCQSVRRLAEVSGASGVDSTVVSVDRVPVVSAGLKHRAFSPIRGMGRLGLSPRLHRWMDTQASTGNIDVIHSHGLWSMTNVYPGWVSRRRNVPLIVSPHGSLATWPFSRGSKFKQPFWHLLQRPAFDRAVMFHATCEAEVEEIRSHGFKMPIVVIPIGVDMPSPEVLAKLDKMRTVVFLSRIHPKKGIEELIRAWKAVEQRFDGWDLQIAGPDHGQYAKSMKALVVELGLRRVKFIGEVSGASKFERLAGASVFVLPTHSENFGMVVAEALACGTPAIVTKGAPWGELDRRSAGWWIDHGREPLAAALERAMGSSMASLRSMGQRGREWMLREYQWSRIGELFAHTYKSLLGGSAPPDLVRLL